MNQLINVTDGKATTTSLKVAEQYDKRHSDVIRRIETIIKYEPRSQRNFALVKYKDQKGEMRKSYEMDRQGFSMVVLGFTGQDAIKFTYDYTMAFEQMENTIRDISHQVNLSSSIEKRIQSLEDQLQTNMSLTAPSVVALPKVVREYFTALETALKSGEYCVYLSNKKTPKTCKVLGRYNGEYLYLKSATTYELYKAETDNPLSHRALYQVFKGLNILVPYSKQMTTEQTFNDKDIRCIRLRLKEVRKYINLEKP